MYSESMSSPTPLTPVFNPTPTATQILNPKPVFDKGEEDRSKPKGKEDAYPEREKHAEEMHIHNLPVEILKSNVWINSIFNPDQQMSFSTEMAKVEMAL
ncbi:hypothetical protein VNO77_18140 [Canavalia gladiata]|uniref:Uncharacterized protein n=1 Tax=Canavalia gladiata TaxID=3824 RepID=A0AAN9LK94_CANGL